MAESSERLKSRLRASALTVLLRHGVQEDELRVDESAPEAPAHCELSAHRIRIHLTDRSASFQARGGRWSGERKDYPSDGALVATFEEELHRALSGRSRS